MRHVIATTRHHYFPTNEIPISEQCLYSLCLVTDGEGALSIEPRVCRYIRRSLSIVSSKLVRQSLAFVTKSVNSVLVKSRSLKSAATHSVGLVERCCRPSEYQGPSVYVCPADGYCRLYTVRISKMSDVSPNISLFASLAEHHN